MALVSPILSRFYDRSMTKYQRRTVDTSPESVRAAHAAMFRRLRRQIDVHRSELSPAGLRLLTHVAFALYVDSRDSTSPAH
jgi:hypothetical protein